VEWNQACFRRYRSFDAEPRPKKIEAAITPQTTAILAVHCYGHPCDVDAIQGIADNYNLKVIYDAAHAFGVAYRGGTITQARRSVGPEFSRDQDLHHVRRRGHRQSGFQDQGEDRPPEKLWICRGNHGRRPGINGKMSEFNAALGLLQLKHVDEAIARRQAIDRIYREGLRSVTGIRCLDSGGDERSNFAYFPILVQPDYPMSRDDLYQRLKDHGVYPRRYFFPLISEFPMYRGLPSAHSDNLPAATAAAKQVLCLPIYPDLDLAAVFENLRPHSPSIWGVRTRDQRPLLDRALDRSARGTQVCR
jgi:dTDP-4-amino-4,6-dideoxygalactose transaminase